MTKDPGSRYNAFLLSERRSAALYRGLAQQAEGERKIALEELAAMEDGHAGHWAAKLRELGQAVPADDYSLDSGDAALLERARSESLAAVLPALEQAERDGAGMYDAEPDALPSMAIDERKHAEVLAQMARPVHKTNAAALGKRLAGEVPTDPAAVHAVLTQTEPWHRIDRSGAVRAAIFGISDGLVSNTALVMGFAGAGASGSSSPVLFAGVAGLLAGAFSMGAGEFVSVSSQRELYQRELDMEASELAEKPEEERKELELIYRAKGLDREAARTTSERIMANPKTALDTLAREELGLDPNELGSPWKVAGSSFAAFAVGALVPVLPYLFATGTVALVAAVLLAVLALTLVGATVGTLSGRGWVHSAIRQVLVGGGAAGVTFIVGSLIGTRIG